MRETQNLLIAVGRRSNPRLCRIFSNSRLSSIFYCFLKLLFVVFSLRLCVEKVCSVARKIVMLMTAVQTNFPLE